MQRSDSAADIARPLIAAMLNASHHYHDAQHKFSSIGIDVKDMALNLPKMLAYKDKAVKGLTSVRVASVLLAKLADRSYLIMVVQGIEGLFKKYKVDYVKGYGALSGKNAVSVDLSAGQSCSSSVCSASLIRPVVVRVRRQAGADHQEHHSGHRL